MRCLFPNLASNRSGNLEKSVNFQNPQTLAAARTAGCCEWALARKAPMPFSCSFFGALESCSNSPKTGSKSLSATRMLPFPEGVYTSAHTAKHGVFRMGALLLPSECSTRFGNPAWPGFRTANFTAFGSWPGVLQKNAESLRNSDALMRVAVPRRRGPAGLHDLFATW